jgi:hypothetical protein
MTGNNFIEEVLDRLQKDSGFFMHACVLMPTKRACLQFRDTLTRHLGTSTAWLPAISSIQDFLYQEVPYTILPDEDLVARLHGIHAAATKQVQSFASFQKWGQMMLKDFNEIDQYLIDPDFIFHYVREYKEIEAQPVLSEEQQELLNQFWQYLPSDTQSEIRQRFLRTWESLGDIYAGFHQELAADGLAYEGMACRALLDMLEKKNRRFKYRHFIIAGFNALSTFEERLFLHLSGEYDTTFYWDAEAAWLSDKDAEPGYFLRRYKNLFPPGKQQYISTAGEGPARKQVVVTEVPLDILQVEHALELAGKWGPDDTVAVLCDEGLVFPMAFRLGGKDMAYNANITMGFPVGMSAMMSFVKCFIDLQAYWLKLKRISPSLLLKLTAYSGLRTYLAADRLRELEKRITNWGFINRKDIEELFGDEPFFRYLLDIEISGGKVNAAEMISGIMAVLELLPAGPKGNNSGDFIRESMYERLESIRAWAEVHGMDLEPGEAWAVIRNGFTGLRIPFDRKEDAALQVMGFLETRNLDFRNVIVLSADEDHLPGSNRHTSFIPRSIRRALDMPTHREHDAIYSYHFFRLLMRAENIALMYTSRSAGTSPGRSRFIEQILHEWRNRDDVEISEEAIRIGVPATGGGIRASIGKEDDTVQAALKKYTDGGQQFSASSFSSYIHCPFQFYLKYIAGLEEPEEFSEDYDQRDLGRIFHRAMEVFYQPFLESGEIITGESLAAGLKKSVISEVITKAYELEKYSLRPGGLAALRGKNFLVNEVIEELMRRIIAMDMQGPPFRIAGLEMRLSNVELRLKDGRSVFVKGFLDRSDEVHEAEGRYIRIIDYKTGKADMLSQGRKTSEEYLSGYFSNSRYKEGFQGYVYAWLYHRLHPSEPLKVGFYSARNIRGGLKYLFNGKLIDPNHLAIFEDYLVDLATEILDSDQPFEQTDRRDAYRFSAYEVLADQF